MKTRYDIKEQIIPVLRKFLSVDNSLIKCEEIKEQRIMLAEAHIENLHLMSKDYDCDPFPEAARLHCLRDLPTKPELKLRARFKRIRGADIEVIQSIDLDMFLWSKELTDFESGKGLTKSGNQYLKSLALRILDEKNNFLMERKNSKNETTNRRRGN